MKFLTYLEILLQDVFKKFPTVFGVFSKLFVLPHGQSRVEGGFSINLDSVKENHKTDTIVALRYIKDYLNHNCKNISEFKIDKDLRRKVLKSRSCVGWHRS